MLSGVQICPRMPPVTIHNPVINSPFAEPQRHYFFDDRGITDKIIPQRRPSSYFVPIAQSRSRSDGQQTIEDWTGERIEANPRVDKIRLAVRKWLSTGVSSGTTAMTRRLLEHWTSPERDRPLFFCQIEALQTLIYIGEVAHKAGDHWIANELKEAEANANPGLLRMATKMATGSGKTVVMAMLIAWHTLNKVHNPQDARFTDSFLIVTPGITIRDRLRVLMPNDSENYYQRLDLVPADLRDDLARAKIVITNYHAFQPREKVKASRLTKEMLFKDGKPSPALTETTGEMVRRVCRALGTSKQVLVINDEAHHCYQRNPESSNLAPESAQPRLTGEERVEAEKRNKAAHLWLNGLQAVAAKIGIKAVHDLSATPFFLRGSGYSEGTLFPWVVSDFSLIDAIESGIVKVPRVPVDDDATTGQAPTYRELWPRIRDSLPKKGRDDHAPVEPRLPMELEGALRSLYVHYEKRFKKWQSDPGASGLVTPPVFIVVCNNTTVSKMVFDWISGYQRSSPVGSRGGTPATTMPVVVPGELALFSNVERGADGVTGFSHRPNTILVDSEQLESGEALSGEFKAIAAREIDEFKQEYRARNPGADPDKLTDEDILREVLNTVGKPGKLGEHVRCVVSVSMLTEGWDANTVTHILGVRAFGTQLLCEQVVGRGLRRISYRPRPVTVTVDGQAHEFTGFGVEYAEVYGVPFSFIPASGAVKDPKPGPPPTRVRSLPERANLEMRFPNVDGYRYELEDAPLAAEFNDDSKMAVSSRPVPTRTEVAPIVGETETHTQESLMAKRPQEVAFSLARRVLHNHIQSHADGVQPWRFPELVTICREWIEQCLTLKDRAYVGLLVLAEHGDGAADRIYKAIVRASTGGQPSKRLVALMNPYATESTTSDIDFDTTRRTWATPAKCHLSHVVADTQSWEQVTAQALEEMPEVICYVKNMARLNFTIPYLLNGEPRRYFPDFLVWLNDGRGESDPLKLILEVSGKRAGDDREGDAKAVKASTTRDLWVPAVNAAGVHGRWAYLEVLDPWDVQGTIRSKMPALCRGADRSTGFGLRG